MLPDPLHPAIVHFPVVLAVLLPISAGVALWAIRRGNRPGAAWSVPLAVALAMTLSGWVALRTGEAEEDRVEAYVDHEALEDHEHAAERFLLFAGVWVLVGGVGIARGTLGKAARIVATAGTLVVLASAVQVGHAGGELVYRHGAAQAYVDRDDQVDRDDHARRRSESSEEDDHR